MKISSHLMRVCVLNTLFALTVTARAQQGSLAYTTIDDPLGTGGTEIYGVSGNNIVGAYQDGTGTHGFIYNGSTYTTLTDPGGISDTTARAIDGDNVLENYSGGSFVYNIATGAYTILNVPGPANGISGDQVVGSYNGVYNSFYAGTLGYDYSTEPEAAPVVLFILFSSCKIPQASSLIFLSFWTVAITCWRSSSSFCSWARASSWF
jgi:hypothetical protein